MTVLKVQDFLKDRILVSRESARAIEGAMGALIPRAEAVRSAGDTAELTVDFQGVEGVSPSFIDELVRVFEELVEQSDEGRERRLIIAHPPTRLSSKFEAIARGHKMTIRVLDDGSWSLTGRSEVGS